MGAPLPGPDRSSQVVEGFYLETLDGLFFAVKGLIHPPDRLVAVLRYAPDPDHGERCKGERRYRRLYHFAEQEAFLQAGYPQYLAYDPAFQVVLQSVPWQEVRRVYHPCQYLQALAQQPERSPLEEDAVAFAELLHKAASAPAGAVGLTGSMLIGLHTAASDLDFIVYGEQACRAVYRALLRLLDEGADPRLRRLDAAGVDELYRQRAADTRMELKEFVRLEARKVNQGRFRERTYFMRFVMDPKETGEQYGDLRFLPLGTATITATVADDRQAIFTPCRYPLAEAHIMKGPPVQDLREIVSFRGRFCEQARRGEPILATGTLERVQQGDDRAWHRLLLGNAKVDTMIVLR